MLDTEKELTTFSLDPHKDHFNEIQDIQFVTSINIPF